MPRPTTSFLRGLARRNHVFGKERRRREDARALVVLPLARSRRSPRRCRSFVLVEEENRRSPAGRGPVEEGGGRGETWRDACGRKRRGAFQMAPQSFVRPADPSTHPPAPGRAFSLSSPSAVPPSFPLSTSLRARQDGRQGSAGDFRSGESVDVESSGK